MMSFLVATCVLLCIHIENSRANNLTASFKWHQSNVKLPTPLHGLTTGFWNGTVFVIGGRDDTYTHRSEIYTIDVENILSNSNDSTSWTSIGSWSTDATYGLVSIFHCTTCNVQVNNLLYMLGSANGNANGKMLIYDLESQTQIAGNSYDYSMPQTLRYPCTVSNGTHIFVMGGQNSPSTGPLKYTQIYEIGEDS